MKKLVVVLLIISAVFTITPKKPKPPQGIAVDELMQDFHSIPAGSTADIQVFCSEGKMVLGGGFKGPREDIPFL